MSEAPMTFSFDPGLDLALSLGWSKWIEVARNKGVERTSEWFLRRNDLGLDPGELEPLVAALLDDGAPFERAMAATELAEYVEDDDDAVAAVLWEGVLVSGRDANDSEIFFEGLSQLAQIEDDYGDPQAAAALYVDFLNWVREGDHPAEAETILGAFDHLISLAEADGAPMAAANFGHIQTRFFQSVDGDDRRIVSADWEPGQPAYAVWTD